MLTPTSRTDFGTTSRRSQDDGGITDVVHHPFGHISWSAVFAGAVIALAVQLVLTLIGAAIGLATLNPASGDSPSANALGVGAGIWLVVTSILSLLIGGYIGARLSNARNGWLHGLTTWGVVTLLTTILLSTAVGGLIGSASGLANFANTAGAGPEVRRTTRAALDPSRTNSGDLSMRDAAVTARPGTTTAGPPPNEQQVREKAQTATERTAAGTGAAALGLILGAIAAIVGGRLAERHIGRVDRRTAAFAAPAATNLR
jgi:hypothetical protein